ncbi:MAG: histone family protein [Methanocellales archaeon]
MPKELELPNAPMARLMKAAGAERVSDEACVALAEVLEKYALKISREAALLAKHAGRKTIKAVDIALAVERISR